MQSPKERKREEIAGPVPVLSLAYIAYRSVQMKNKFKKLNLKK